MILCQKNHFFGHFGFPGRPTVLINIVIWIILPKYIAGVSNPAKIGRSFELLFFWKPLLSKTSFFIILGGGHFELPRPICFKNAVIWIILLKSIVGLRYLPKISCSFHSLLVLRSFLSKKSFFTFPEGYFGTLLRLWFFMEGLVWVTVAKSNLGLGFWEKIGYTYQFFTIL